MNNSRAIAAMFARLYRLRASVVMSFACITLALGGCASTSGYKQPIADFRDASAAVVDSAKTYIRELNKTERDAYVDRNTNDKTPITIVGLEKAQAFDET
jgi:hypothetical protein